MNCDKHAGTKTQSIHLNEMFHERRAKFGIQSEAIKCETPVFLMLCMSLKIDCDYTFMPQ